MKRLLLLLLLPGCQGPREYKQDPLPEGKKERSLSAFTDQARSIHQFRAFYEWEDHSTHQGILLEMAYDSSGRAKLGFPGKFEVYLIEGVATAFLERSPSSWYQIEYQKEFDLIRSEYAHILKFVESLRPEIQLNLPGQILFNLGPWETLDRIQSLEASLRFSLFPGRFGWLRDLQDPSYQREGENIFQKDGNGRDTASVQIELLKNGFLRKVQILPPPLLDKTTHPGMTLTLKQLTLGPLPPEVFAIPKKGKRTDLTSSIQGQLRATLVNELEKTIFRTLLLHPPLTLTEADRTSFLTLFTLLYQIDLQATHDLQSMVTLIKEGLEKMVTYAQKEGATGGNPEEIVNRYRTEMEMQFETNLRHVDQFEHRVAKEYQHLLRRNLKGLALSRTLQEDLESLSKKGVLQAINNALRKPVKKIYKENVERITRN